MLARSPYRRADGSYDREAEGEYRHVLARYARLVPQPMDKSPSYAPAGGLYLNNQFRLGGEMLAPEDQTNLSATEQKRLGSIAETDPQAAERLFSGRQAVPQSPRDQATRRAVDQASSRAISEGNYHVDSGRQDIPRIGGKQRGRAYSVPEAVPDLNGVSSPAEKRELLGDAASHLRDDELDRINHRNVQQFLGVLQALPPDQEWVAAARAGKSKREWYRQAAKALSTLFGPEAPRFVALLAATSPRVSVRQNFAKALNIWAWYQGKRAEQPAGSWLPSREEVLDWIREERALGRWPSIAGGKDATLPAHDNNTATALSALPDELSREKFGSLLSGFKVDAFRRNLMGDEDAVTNDTWQTGFAELHQKLADTPWGYLALNQKTRQVAAQANADLPRGEKPWTPAQVQAAVWSFFRTLAFVGGKSRTPGHPQQERLGGAASGPAVLAGLRNSDIAGAADFVDLLKDPEVQARVRKLGPEYAASLDAFLGSNAKATRRPGKAADSPIEGHDDPSLGRAARAAARRQGPFIGHRIREARHPLDDLYLL